MIDLNRLKELEKKATPGEILRFGANLCVDRADKGLCVFYPSDKQEDDGELFKELRNALPAIIRELEAGRKVEDEAECLTTHNAFGEGTASYDKLPIGMIARVKALQVALAEYRRAREGG